VVSRTRQHATLRLKEKHFCRSKEAPLESLVLVKTHRMLRVLAMKHCTRNEALHAAQHPMLSRTSQCSQDAVATQRLGVKLAPSRSKETQMQEVSNMYDST